MLHNFATVVGWMCGWGLLFLLILGFSPATDEDGEDYGGAAILGSAILATIITGLLFWVTYA